MFGKSRDVVERRRDCKRRTVDMLVRCAEMGPMAIAASHKLSEEQTGIVTVLAGEFFNQLSPASRQTLMTAKGCQNCPSTAIAKNYRHCLEFLEIPTTSVNNAGCMGSWTEDAFKWAKQIVESNPHAFPDGFGEFDQRVQQAISQVRHSDESYINNPYDKGEPTTVDQARAFLLFKAGYIYFYEAEEVQSDAEVAWRPLFNTLRAEIRNNPNIEAIRDRKGFAWALNQSRQKYFPNE